MAMNKDVQKGNFAVNLFFSRKFDARVDAVEAVVEGLSGVGKGVVGA